MSLWLFKEEPSCYSFADLERDGETTWSGISNALALKNLRRCKRGDRVLFYHTGKEKAVVGIMKVTRGHSAQAPKAQEVAVTVVPAGRLPRPVTLAQIKSDKALADWDLVRISRLSVMPVTEAQWERVEMLANQADE